MNFEDAKIRVEELTRILNECIEKYRTEFVKMTPCGIFYVMNFFCKINTMVFR